MGYGDFKALPRRTASDKILYNKAFDIVKNPKYEGYQGGLASMVHKFLIKSCLLSMQINLLVLLLKVKLCQTKN